MIVNKKLALAEALRTWRSLFGDDWVTAQQAIHYLCHPYYSDILEPLGMTSRDGDELSRCLDELRNKGIYNFVVKRDVPFKQPVKWRILLQDKRVEISDEERKDFLAVRKEAGLKIDPATAEVSCSTVQVLDPYGILELSAEEYCAGRQYFARSPGSDIWVWFGDLPSATAKVLSNRG